MNFQEFGGENSNLAEFYFQAGGEHWISSGTAESVYFIIYSVILKADNIKTLEERL